MGELIGILSLIGVFIFLGLCFINKSNKNKLKKYLIGLIVCIAIFSLCLLFVDRESSNKEKKNEVGNEKQTETKAKEEDENIHLENEKKENESEKNKVEDEKIVKKEEEKQVEVKQKENKTKDTVKQEQKETPKKEVNKPKDKPVDVVSKQKQDVLHFEKKIHEIEAGFDVLYQSYLDALHKNDIDAAHKVAVKGWEETRGKAYAFALMEIPKGLPITVENDLKEAADNFKEAYYAKHDGFVEAIHTMTNGKPLDLSLSKEIFDKSEEYISVGRDKLIAAKEKIGIKN